MLVKKLKINGEQSVYMWKQPLTVQAISNVIAWNYLIFIVRLFRTQQENITAKNEKRAKANRKTCKLIATSQWIFNPCDLSN